MGREFIDFAQTLRRFCIQIAGKIAFVTTIYYDATIKQHHQQEQLTEYKKLKIQIAIRRQDPTKVDAK